MQHGASRRLFEEAQRLLPGGVDSPVRAFRAVGGEPFFVARGAGALLTDADGNDYLDYVGSWGPLILGHAHPAVVAALREATERGTSYGAPTELEVRLARQVREAFPSIEMLRFVSSGTEAAMSAIRVARGFTGREKVIKFAGCYHGHADSLLVKAGSGAATFGVPDSAGVPAALARETIALPFNDLDAVRRTLDAVGREVACLILEPVVGNMGVVLPRPGFLSGLRELTARHGVLLIFDEVITGFRFAPGGAQEYYGVTPDLTTLAKILAGGLPGGAVVGRRDAMDLLAFREDATWNRHQRVAHAGTYNANPVCAAAGIATLELIADGQAQRRANQLGEALRAGLNAAAERVGADVRAYGECSCINVFLEPGRLGVDINGKSGRRDHTALQTHPNMPLYHTLRCAMLLNGVDLPAFHGWLSAVHTEQDLEQTITAFEKALRMMQEEGCFA